MINRLPAWCIINKFPAFYDIESATAIEQTARIYGKMNELVENYNAFAETLTNTINNYIDESEQDHETFKVAIRQEFQDFINVIDLKMLDIEKDIADFESSTDTKLNGFANDIASFKTSMTTSFTTLKTYVEDIIANHERYVDTSLENLKKEVNGTITELSQNIYKDLGAATIPLYVTIDENNQASHTPEEMYYKLEGGANVYLEINNMYVPINTLYYTNEDKQQAYAIFIAIDENVCDTWFIDDTGVITQTQTILGGSGSGGNVDLTDYVKKTDIASATTPGLVIVKDFYGTTLSSDGAIMGMVYDNEKYQTRQDSILISKGTLNNILTPLIARIEALENQ